MASPSTATATATATARGCSASGSGIPSGATKRSIGDVDGDGKSDTEWFSGTRFGITTASRATMSVTPHLAGGATPRALTTKVPGTTTEAIFVVGSRDAALFRFSSCRIQPVLNKQGEQYTFDLTNAHGDGVGCEDPSGGGHDSIVGYRLSKPYGSLSVGQKVTVYTTTVAVSGLRATNGATTTVTTSLPAGRSTLDRATAVSCGSATLKADGLSAKG